MVRLFNANNGRYIDSRLSLVNAMLQRSSVVIPGASAGLLKILSIELEDGSGWNFNVCLQPEDGSKNKTVFLGFSRVG